MAEPSRGPRATSAPELKEQIEAERRGVPFLVHRDGDGEQRIIALSDRDEMWLGRGPSAAVQLGWDPEVSSLHAQIEIVGSECTLVDDGLSTNGSFVNGERVRGRRRLRDGDVLRLGQTMLLYRSPAEAGAIPDSTALSADALGAAGVSPAQKRVLVALCRPFKDGAAFATPATNQAIAEELTLSVEAVKTHLRALFEKFGVAELPQNQKRLALVERALQSGLVNERDL
jgi:hypothetical protein